MPEVAVALITAAATLLAVFLAAHLTRRSSKDDEANALLSKYREPLLAAAFELQSRLWNILEGSFLEVYLDEDPEYATQSTVWLVGQYLGWVEILRSEVQFLDLGSASTNQELQERLRAISHAFGSDRQISEPTFRLFRAQQRAIGEIMTMGDRPSEEQGQGPRQSVGYAGFLARRTSEDFFSGWFERLDRDVRVLAAEPSKRARMRKVQNALVDLVHFLDPSYLRYPPELLEKA